MTVIHDNKGNAITEFSEVSGNRVMPVDLTQYVDLNTTSEARLYAYRDLDESYQALRIDEATNSLYTVDHLHHEVHEGNYYRSGMNFTLANGNVATFGFTTPNTTTWAHMTWNLSTTADGTFTLLENVTSFSGGASVTPLNQNRNSSNKSKMTCIRGMTGSNLITPTGGTTILNAALATAKGSILSRDTGEEFIMKQNSKYLFRYTNGTSSNVIQLVLTWYEHVNIA